MGNAMSLINSASFEQEQSTIVKTMLLGEEGVGKSTFVDNLLNYNDELKNSKSGILIHIYLIRSRINTCVINAN